MTPENILNYMESKIKALRQPGTLFPTAHLSEVFQSPPQAVEEIMKGLELNKKVYRDGKSGFTKWGLGGNPWGGQRRQKIFRCQHCGQQNTVDITGD